MDESLSRQDYADTSTGRTDGSFPNQPDDWTPQAARGRAQKEDLALTDEHWNVIRALQEYYARHRESPVQLAELKESLEQTFDAQGGGRYLHELFPGGPVAQGCRLAGLKAPAGATDNGFGSVA